MIDQGYALRSTNGDDSHNSGTGVRRTERTARECTYTTFLNVNHYLSKALKELLVFAMMMFSDESDKIEKYVGGLPDMIHGSVVASKPKTMQEAIEIATELMDKKRKNTGRVYTAASGGKKQYGGSKPLCAKYNYHNDGPCAPMCHNCNKIGHLARDCRVTANTNNANNQRGTELGQKPTCYECGVKGHYRRECPKLKNNNNQGNQGGRNNAPARVYVVGRAGIDPDANVVTVTNAQLQEMIDQGVTAALAARDALRSTNGDDSHNSGTGVRRTER
nr:hypothetical protein [Tanacetum cinerariifolium]